MARNRSIWIRLFVLFLLVAVISCGSKDHELLENMGDMRRHTAKLGYSIQAKNGPLAEFYLEEVLEIMEELREIEAYEGIPVAKSVRTILDPTVPALESALAASNWEEAEATYETFLNGCNRCHAALEHEFIFIVPVKGTPPFNQDFAPRENNAND